jgi:hypothetical protein
MTCPKCASANIRRSSTSIWKDVLPSLRGREPFRCRECRHRFFALRSADSSARGPDRSARNNHHRKFRNPRKKNRIIRRLFAFAVLVLMFSLFGVFLHYITTDHAPTGDAQDMSLPSQ